MSLHPTAKESAASILQNVADVSADRISWEEFSARQHSAWAAASRGFFGSAATRRILAVHAAMKAVEAAGEAEK